MPGDPESPPPPPDSRNERDQSQKPELRRSRGPKEKREARDGVERVPECPFFRRQMLFTRPFTIYGDIIDADARTGGRQETDVPAIYHVVDTTKDGLKLAIGDESGKSIGWILTSDNPGYEWNIRSILRPSQRILDEGHITAYTQPEISAGSVDIAVDKKTVFPILRARKQLNGDIWYLVGASLGADRVAAAIRKPLWIPSRTADGTEQSAVSGTPHLVATKRELADFTRSLRLIVNTWNSSTPAQRSSCLDGLRLAHLRLMGGHTAIRNEQDVETINAYLQRFNAGHEIFHGDLPSAQLSVLVDDAETTLRVVTERLEDRKQVPAAVITVNGNREELYDIIVY